MTALLIFKLREPNRIGGKLMNEAADAIEKLEAENAALKSDALEWQRTHTAQANTIDALKLEHKECVRCLGEALQEATDEHLKNDALKSELAALRDQKPVAWFIPARVDMLGNVHHWEQVLDKTKTPLYAAPGANHG